MSETETRPTNFVRQMIEKDLSDGKFTKIKTRFPPEPNGYLHIGHAKSICLNFGLAKDFNGTCNLRFDDTNPEKEENEYVKSIQEDVKWLGFKWEDPIRYSSDYFQKFYEFAVELIQKNLAYIDELSAEQIREFRGTLKSPGKNSPFRSRPIEENLMLFEKMKNGEIEEGKMCLRAKIDMSSPFIVMRDPVIYRVKFAEHHQTGNKWCIYPMYDFAHCISDTLEGITHSLCTLEFQDNRRLYDWILENITIKNPSHQFEFSRLNLEYTITSKRRLNFLVNEKIVDGWDDPRMPTISGFRRKGYTPESIREFCRRIGVTKQENVIEINALEACIRDDLNENSPRRMAVLNPIKVIINNFNPSDEQILNVSNHPNRQDLGTRNLPFSNELFIDRADFREEANKQYKRLVLGKEVRLRNAFVIKAESIEKDEMGEIQTIFCSYDPKTLGKNPEDGRKIKGVIHWVDAKTAIPARFNIYKHLFNVANPAAEEDFLATINQNSLTIKYGFVEQSLHQAEVQKAFQFEREGYFCRDKNNENNKIIFNLTVGLKENLEK